MTHAHDPLASKITSARTVHGAGPSEYQVPFRNIGELLRKQAATYADKPWLIFYPDAPGERKSTSYREFHELVRTTASFLLEHGIVRGERIATVAYNHADTVVQYFAAWYVGAVVVPINTGEDDKRIGYILNNSGVKLAFVREEYFDRMKQIIGPSPSPEIVRVGAHRPADGLTDGSMPVRSTDPLGSVDHNLTIVSPEDESLIVYTSGTTGLPKGVVLTHYNLLIDAKAIAEWHGMTPDQRMMCVLPIHHVNGTVVTLMTPMYFGGTVILNQKFHSNTFFERAANERVSVVSVVPTLLQFLLHDYQKPPACDISSLRHIICGAGPLTCELALAYEERFNIPIVHGYGLSETTCYSCFLPLDLSPEEHTKWLKEYGFPSIGVPIASNEMAIHDEHGNELPEGTRGEIVIRGHNVMKEYYSNQEANENTFIHGWFRSGDEGFYKLDPDGRRFFFITGRLKELIIRGGSNISPFEIDEVLMNMPGVKAGLAVGFENDWYGEEVGAYVQRDGGWELTEADVLNYCRTFFSFQKSPKVVIFGDNIPVTSTGKYQRNRLKPLFEKWKSVQFKDPQGSQKSNSSRDRN